MRLEVLPPNSRAVRKWPLVIESEIRHSRRRGNPARGLARRLRKAALYTNFGVESVWIVDLERLDHDHECAQTRPEHSADEADRGAFE